MMTTVVLARHGRTEWHHGNRYTGSSDLPIDGVGQQQAERLRDWATEFAQRLRELDFGEAEGRMLSELPPAVATAFQLDPVGWHLPGGEDPVAAANRVQEVFQQICRDHEGQKVLVVAHNTLIRLLVCRVLGLELRDYRRLLPVLGPAALVRLRCQDGTVGLEAYNIPAVRTEIQA